MEKKETTNIIVLLALIIIAVAYFFLLPRFQSIASLSKQVAIKDVEATALTQKVSSLKTLKTEFSAKAQLISDLQTALPVQAKAEEIFVMLQSIATSSGVIITNIQPSATNAQSPTGAVVGNADVSVTVSGDFPSIVKFSSGLSGNLRPVEIYSVNIVAQDQEEDQARLSATFETGFLIAKPMVPPTTTTPTKEGV